MTKPDFQNEHSRENLRETISELLKLNIIPIVNANDAVAPPPEPDMDLAGVGFCSMCSPSCCVVFVLSSVDI